MALNMKRKIIITILILIALLGVVVGVGMGNILDNLEYKKEIFQFNLSQIQKDWVTSNYKDVGWVGDTFEVSNNNTFKMNFCYTLNEVNETAKCTKIMLIRDYSTEKIRCTAYNNKCVIYNDAECNESICIGYDRKDCIEWECISYDEPVCIEYDNSCLEWGEYTLGELLEIKYVEKADEVLARLYRNNNKKEPTKIDVGDKTLKTSVSPSP